MTTKTVFGPAYFRKFYLKAATRVTTPNEMRSRARLIAAVLAHAGIPVRSILDAGCGIGLLRKPFAEVLPRVGTKAWRRATICATDMAGPRVRSATTRRASPAIWRCATTCCNTWTIEVRRVPSRISRDCRGPRSIFPR